MTWMDCSQCFDKQSGVSKTVIFASIVDNLALPFFFFLWRSLDELPRVRRFHVLDTTVCDCDVLINQFNKIRRYVQTLTKGTNESDLQPRNLVRRAMTPTLHDTLFS